VSSRRSRPTASHRRNRSEPMILSARRPITPAPHEASASGEVPPPEAVTDPPAASEVGTEEKPRAPRAARIVSASTQDVDGRLLERERLLSRILSSQGRGAITRAADQYRRAGFDFPIEQAVQLQLLEHLDEGLVRGAIAALRGIVVSEPPLKRPIFEQRLKRLEDSAEEESTRTAAAELRRALRT
jgi:hypothetical protein